MLAEGQRPAGLGADVVVTLVETHGRSAGPVAAGLEIAPRRSIAYRGTSFGDLDVDAVLARRPAVALVDELAHRNVPGSRRDSAGRTSMSCSAPTSMS
jgi:two-component system sensor histidine kinase KdpD